jgi:hypothetical protein
VDNVTTVTSTLLCFSLGVLLRSSFDLDTNVPISVQPKVLFMDQVSIRLGIPKKNKINF